MSTRARARTRPPSGVFDKILGDGHDGGDLGDGADQEGILHERGAVGGVDDGRRRAQGGRSDTTGDTRNGAEGVGENLTYGERRNADLEDMGDNGINIEQMIPDESHKGGNLMSGGQAFPPSLLTSANESLNQFMETDVEKFSTENINGEEVSVHFIDTLVENTLPQNLNNQFGENSGMETGH